MGRYLKFIFISIIFIVLQTTVANIISIRSISPDFLLIWIVLIAIRYGQVESTLFGFAIGLLYDLATGGVIGLSSLSKSVSGFVAGYFYNENKTEITLGSYRFLLIVLLTALLHNLFYYLIYLQGSELNTFRSIVMIGGITALYTTTISLMPVFIFMRKYSFIR
ncbi:MAG: rod shape-determining protein MreD [Bacteroidota bacterium]|nr:rod shape-determining protein MreD [Bacteroidota bacterium]